MDLAYLWFWIVGFLFIGYFVLDGFDFGVGMSLPFLGKDDIARRQIIDQAVERIALGCGHESLAIDRATDFRRGLDEIGRRIGQQGRQRAKGPHHATSIGCLAFCRSLPPENRLPPSSAGEQPSPKLKPQAPRSL